MVHGTMAAQLVVLRRLRGLAVCCGAVVVEVVAQEVQAMQGVAQVCRLW